MRVHAEDPHQRVRAQVKYVRLAACIARDQHAAVAAERRAQDRIVEPRQRVKHHRALERKEVNLHRRGYRNVVRRLRRELDVRRGLRLEPRGRVSAGHLPSWYACSVSTAGVVVDAWRETREGEGEGDCGCENGVRGGSGDPKPGFWEEVQYTARSGSNEIAQAHTYDKTSPTARGLPDLPTYPLYAEPVREGKAHSCCYLDLWASRPSILGGRSLPPSSAAHLTILSATQPCTRPLACVRGGTHASCFSRAFPSLLTRFQHGTASFSHRQTPTPARFQGAMDELAVAPIDGGAPPVTWRLLGSWGGDWGRGRLSTYLIGVGLRYLVSPVYTAVGSRRSGILIPAEFGWTSRTSAHLTLCARDLPASGLGAPVSRSAAAARCSLTLPRWARRASWWRRRRPRATSGTGSAASASAGRSSRCGPGRATGRCRRGGVRSFSQPRASVRHARAPTETRAGGEHERRRWAGRVERRGGRRARRRGCRGRRRRCRPVARRGDAPPGLHSARAERLRRPPQAARVRRPRRANSGPGACRRARPTRPARPLDRPARFPPRRVDAAGDPALRATARSARGARRMSRSASSASSCNTFDGRRRRPRARASSTSRAPSSGRAMPRSPPRHAHVARCACRGTRPQSRSRRRRAGGAAATRPAQRAGR